ncbi:MAG: hypothetical protein Q8R24_01065 [Legionellaceae bacterium]|nr:hypothetical protein [Legionellaceae bacterium]
MELRDELKSRFAAAYEKKRTYFEVEPIGAAFSHGDYTIYKLWELDKLIAELKKIPIELPDDDYFEEGNELERLTVRVVVDKSYQVLFAREGALNRITPAHSQMAFSCFFAGTLRFSNDYTRILEMTNKSGHFRPEFGSIVFLIAALEGTQHPLLGVHPIDITEYTGCEVKKIVYAMDALESLLPPAVDIESIANVNMRPKHSAHEAEVQPFSKKHRLNMSVTNSSDAFFSNKSNQSIERCTTPPPYASNDRMYRVTTPSRTP